MIVEITKNGSTYEYHIPDYMDFSHWLRGYTLDGSDPIDYMRVIEWEG